ncbi:OLC1v1036615C1 [Oldenlandia corymbosa var. corymbosa]|uniref:OLC1v1036615C1 n=1 Tax=Oldenlandia corymbosa var. corymbosa TaxID=529605 RepID=A0AAV1CWN1_OLDCO|nr:OLC1v1036615C1 [Oldenlandia corymbosa var. corymbosa]
MAPALLRISSLPSAISFVNVTHNNQRSFLSPQLFKGLRKKLRCKNSGQIRCGQSAVRNREKNNEKDKRKNVGRLILSEGREEDGDYGPICPGCGVFMQDKDPDLPGFFKRKKVENYDIMEDESGEFYDSFVDDEDDDELEDFDEDDEDLEDFDGDDEEFEDDIEEKLKGDDAIFGKFVGTDGVEWDLKELEAEFEKDDDELKELDGFGPATVGYGNITEETIKKRRKEALSKSERKRMSRKAQSMKEEVTVCARCHSLRSYGQVKNQSAENLIPDFDFDRLISTRLMKPTGVADSTVVVMVVDCVDFDGSFPKRAAKSLFTALEESKEGSKLNKRLPKLVLVATKVDLLPSQISPARLDKWVRRRAKANGAPKLSGVYLVSARKDLGVRNLLAFIKQLAGPRGNVWVIGAQNAGKSTLINAFAKKGGIKVTKLTEAAVPGTTLGILRIGGILSAKAKMYDTPGLLHPYLMPMRLNREEQKMVEMRKELQPRSYRIKEFTLLPGETIHVGSLVRLDLNQASVKTIYVTVWVSSNVSLHLGKTENADEIREKHGGVRLQPPIGADQVCQLGNWVKKEVKASGSSWDVNEMDVAVAGLGWFSLGLKGEASLTLWTYDGVEVTLREPLVLDRAPIIERPGFLLPKAISDAIGNQTKLEAQQKKKLQESSM